MSKKPFRLPRTDERCTILGCTGSGKTTMAAWILSLAPFDKMPYIVIDYKFDDLIANIPRIKSLELSDPIPENPGLYVVRPLPSEIDEVEAWLWKVWEKGNTGLYVDEAYLLPNKAAIKNILAQGRSLRIPVIAASQRPVDVNRSMFTEAQHLVVFRLLDDRDKKTVREFTPKNMMFAEDGSEKLLPDFHSFWYAVKDHTAGDKTPYHIIRPVPSAKKIVEAINARLSPDVRVT